MRATHLSSKVAFLVAILVFALPFTSSLTNAVEVGRAFCASGTCEFQTGSICAGDGSVKYNSVYVPW